MTPIKVRLGLRIALQQLVLFSPFVWAVWVIITYSGQGRVLDSLNHIQGNIYPIASALLLLILAGFIVTFLNLISYIRGVWHEFDRSPSNDKSKKWRRISSALLHFVTFLLGAFSLLIVLTIADFINPPFHQYRWMNYLLTISSWLTVLIFILFLLIDLSIYFSQNYCREQLRKEASALSAGDNLPIALAIHENDLDFSRSSIILIDIPMLIMAAGGLILASVIEGNASFQRFRDMEYPAHLILRDLKPITFELAVYGLQAGMLAATLLLSQIIFAALAIRWQLRDNQIKGVT